jgi:hypothetical protein
MTVASLQRDAAKPELLQRTNNCTVGMQVARLGDVAIGAKLAADGDIAFGFQGREDDDGNSPQQIVRLKDGKNLAPILSRQGGGQLISPERSLPACDSAEPARSPVPWSIAIARSVPGAEQSRFARSRPFLRAATKSPVQ